MEDESILFDLDPYLREIFNMTSLEELAPSIARWLGEFLHADGAYLALYDEGRKRFVPAASVGHLNERVLDWGFNAHSASPAAAALRAGTLKSLKDIDAQLDYDPSPTNAAIFLPLLARKQPLGVLLLSFKQRQLIQPEALEVAQALAKQASFALAAMIAIERDHKRMRELESVRRASLSLTSRLDLQDVLEGILIHALDLVAADDAHIFLFDGQVLSFGSARWQGREGTEPFSSPREHGITYTVARQGERLVIPSVNEHPLYEDWPWGGAIVALPLKIGERVVGVMNVAFDEPHDFDEDELRALELIGDQAAVAIENARLYEQSEGERKRVELLYDLAQDLASTLDPEEILRLALTRLCEDLGGMSSEAFVLDPQSNKLSIRTSYRRDGQTVGQPGKQLDLELGHGFIGGAGSKRKTSVLEDVREETGWRPLEEVYPEVRSAICAPVISGGDLWGVITVFHGRVGGLRQDHVELLEAVAHQLSLALSNAKRYQQVERRLAELNAMRQVAQVVNRRLEMQPLLEEVVRQLGDVLGYPVVEIYLVEEEELILGAALGGLMDEASRHPLSAGIIGRSVRTSQVEYVPDVRQDSDYVAAWPKTKSEIAVPLRVEEVVIGVLNVESPVLHGLTEDDVRLLTLLADHIAIAVENAALYLRLQQHAEHLEKTIQERTAALAEALEQAQEADKIKTQFVSDVSHELRTPLSNILLYLELLSSGNKEKFETYLATLSRETDRLIGLIEDLLAISRLDTGTVSPELKPLHLNRLARSLVEDRKRLFKQQDLQVDMALQERLPPVAADESMLVQVVANLLTNAMHYTPAGGWVTVSTGAHKVDGVCWETLTVADTGLGIPKEEQKRIFERFFRGAASRRTTTPGTGLGLAICKEIIDRHEGRITLESQEGQGSAFTIWLPTQPSGETAVGSSDACEDQESPQSE